MQQLVNEIIATLSEWDNDDATNDNLKHAMEYFCGMWDIAEGYKHAILSTLNDQFNNHQDDLTVEDLTQLLNLLKGNK